VKEEIVKTFIGWVKTRIRSSSVCESNFIKFWRNVGYFLLFLLIVDDAFLSEGIRNAFKQPEPDVLGGSQILEPVVNSHCRKCGKVWRSSGDFRKRRSKKRVWAKCWPNGLPCIRMSGHKTTSKRHL